MAFVSRETRKKETKAFVKDFLKSASFGLILIFIAFGMLIAVNILNSQWQKTLSAKSGDVNYLTAQVKQSTMKLDQMKTESRNLYLGVDLDRKAADDAIALEVFQNALTWTGKDEAQNLMRTLSAKYDGIPRAYYKGVFGVEYYDEIPRSKEVACTFKDFKSYVQSVANDRYRYVAIVSFSQVLKDGTRIQKNFVSTYSIDSAGKFYGFTYEEVIK